MRTVTELGFTAPAFPERAAVQEAPTKGESFFDTLNRAGGNAADAAKVTDDKPENTNQNNENTDTAAEKTPGEGESPKAEAQTETKEQSNDEPDILAQMLALGRMVTAVQPEQKLEVEAVVTETDAAVPVESVAIESSEGDALMQMLTPVENGEEMPIVQNAEVAAVTAENFAETMTQTLAQQVDEPTVPQNVEPVQTAEETEIQLPAADEPTENVEAVQVSVEEEPVENETPVRSGETRVQRSESPADMAPAETVESTETSGNTDFSQMFEGESEGFEAEAEAATDQLTDTSETEIDIDTVQNAPMQQILRSRFASDGAVQNVDNTELAQAIEKAIDRFAEDFRIAEVDVQHITIRLDPEELGSMSITVAAENNVITAKIVTDNKEAASLLSAQIEQFLETMEQKGIKVDKAEVTYNSQLDLGSQTPNEHSGNAHGGRQAISGISAVEMVEMEEFAEIEEDAAAAVAAVQDEATNYYVFDDKYVPSHVYKV